MKRVTYILGATALTAATIGLRTTPIASFQPSTSRLDQTGYVLKPIPFAAVHHQQVGRPRIRLFDSTSGNWSGYAVPLETSSVKDTYSNVEGIWTVPTVTGQAGSTAYSSIWVGLDGYESATVEQIGSEQDWTKNGQQNYVWFEMYPSGAYEIVGFPADPGDSISAEVNYVGQISVKQGRGKTVQESVFQLTIENSTKNVAYSVPTSYTTVASAQRASAEWVVEAPTSRRILPLADFGSAGFSGCTATSIKSGGQPQAISFWPSDPLTMIDPNGGKSTPSSLFDLGTAFSVSWSQ